MQMREKGSKLLHNFYELLYFNYYYLEEDAIHLCHLMQQFFFFKLTCYENLKQMTGWVCIHMCKYDRIRWKCLRWSGVQLERLMFFQFFVRVFCLDAFLLDLHREASRCVHHLSWLFLMRRNICCSHSFLKHTSKVCTLRCIISAGWKLVQPTAAFSFTTAFETQWK